VNKSVPTTEIKDEDIRGKTNTGFDISVQDLVASARNPESSDLSFDFTSDTYMPFVSMWGETGTMKVYSVSNPESGQETSLLCRLALALKDTGSLEEAAYVVENIIERKPYDGYWYHTLASAYTSLYEPERALGVIKRGLKNVRDDAMLYDNAYRLLRDKGRLDEGISMLEVGTKQAQKDTHILYAPLINYLLSRGDINSALDKAQENVSRNSRQSYAYSKRGSVYRAMGKWDQALDDYRRAIELDPQDIFSHIGLGEVFESLQRYDEALLEFQKAQSLAQEKNSKWGMRSSSEHIERIKRLQSHPT
jgi:tetratricopeptide (TPR) repeat protein